MEEFEEFEEDEEEAEEEEEEVEVPRRPTKKPLAKQPLSTINPKVLRAVEKDQSAVVETIKKSSKQPLPQTEPEEQEQEVAVPEQRTITTEELVSAIQELAQRITVLEASNYRMKNSL